MAKTQSGQFRIIGGQWRGRKFSFTQEADVRPTPDRVRETLFNWLASDLPSSRCLDLFAGSGALGLECLSRGAAHAVFIDQAPEVVQAIKKILTTLDCEAANVIQSTVPSGKQIPYAPFDVVFLDPPYHQQLITPCCQWLEQQQLLAESALIYIESENTLTELNLPPNWRLIRSKQAGQVAYHLALREHAPD